MIHILRAFLNKINFTSINVTRLKRFRSKYVCIFTNWYVLADVDPLFCPLDDESIDSDETLLVADIIDAFGGVISRPNELCCEKLNIGN